jgi:hypothetical protein
MNSTNIDINKEYTSEWFTTLANKFIGLKATVFSYSPGFNALYIAFQKSDRYFLLKFSSVTYIKTPREWIFGGLEVEEEKHHEHSSRYKFFDGKSFEVICYFFSVLEIVNGRDLFE